MDQREPLQPSKQFTVNLKLYYFLLVDQRAHGVCQEHKLQNTHGRNAGKCDENHWRTVAEITEKKSKRDHLESFHKIRTTSVVTACFL